MKITYKYSNRKSLALQILDGVVIVRAPYGTPDALIQRFIDAKESWIQKRLAMYQPLGYEGKDRFNVFGHSYSVSEMKSPRFGVRFNEDSIILSVPENKSEGWIRERIDAKFKSDLHDVIHEFLVKHCTFLNIDIPNFKIRKYKRLYGRCSRSGELAFNTYLYHETLEFIEYVVVHELAHLYEFNHSSRFYSVVSKMMPHYKEVLSKKKQIKTHL